MSTLVNPTNYRGEGKPQVLLPQKWANFIPQWRVQDFKIALHVGRYARPQYCKLYEVLYEQEVGRFKGELDELYCEFMAANQMWKAGFRVIITKMNVPRIGIEKSTETSFL